MTIAQLRKRAKERLDCLPPDKVRVAAEFLDYLDVAASRDATAELLRIPGLLEDIEGASADIKKGRFKDWRKVRSMKIAGGTIAWDNGADIDPDVLYYGLKPAWMEQPETTRT